MAKKITVILLENVEGYGHSGDIVNVSEGFARNALFPHGKAAIATDQLQDQHQAKQQKQQQQAQQQLEHLQSLASSYDNTELVLTAKVNPENELYGSIGPKEIASHLTKQGKLNLKPKDIQLTAGPIKSIGTYQATITLSADIDFTLNISVVAEEDSNDAR